MDYVPVVNFMVMEKDEIVINEILAAAKSLFGKFGLRKTTIEDIAIAAGKGKSTLYYYYPGKNEIFEAVVKDEMKTVIKKLRKAVNVVPSARDKLKAFLKIQITAILEYKSFYNILFDDIVISMKILMPLKLKYEQTQLDMINEILLGGMQTGELKELSLKHIQKMSYLIVSAFRGLHFPLSVDADEIRSNEYFDELIDIIIDGIGNS